MLSLQDIDFVEKVGEPRSLDPEHRHEMIQKKMATWREIFLEGLTRQICLARDDHVAWIRIEANLPRTPSLQTTRSYAARPRPVMRLSAFDAIFTSAI